MIIKILLLLSLLVAALLAYRSPLSSRNAALRRLFALGLGWLSLWRRIFELEQRLELLTRSNALHEAQHRMSAGEPVYDPAPRHDEDA